jgi:hypothetical protein
MKPRAKRLAVFDEDGPRAIPGDALHDGREARTIRDVIRSAHCLVIEAVHQLVTGRPGVSLDGGSCRFSLSLSVPTFAAEEVRR